MGHVAIGTYRFGLKAKSHKEALILALQNGVKLIDTSSNYTNGESETLIGNVLSEYPEFNPVVVTKAGYIQGENLDILKELENKIGTMPDLVTISDELKHSFHPLFLRTQIDTSLQRLKKKSLDVFLLHNPEYYFQEAGANELEFYRRIKLAFEFLESEVENGRIKTYGISSNHFVLPHNHEEWVSLEKILEIAQSVSIKNHFTHVQFPLNLIEIGALEKFGSYGAISFFEMAKLNNLITMCNRPLNAFINNNLLRLAHYPLDHFEKKAIEQFDLMLNILEQKWHEELIKDGEEEIESIKEIPLVKDWGSMWNHLQTIDAVEQVYFGHVFPFIASVYGGSVSKEESIPYYEVFENSKLFALKNMNIRAENFFKEAISKELIEETDPSMYAVKTVETYLKYGVDFCLVGMKEANYVKQLAHLF
jgi:aryl-alcohol dehydrogenase-like predicted oxidoreductase